MSWARLRLVLLCVCSLLLPSVAWAVDPLSVTPNTATVTTGGTQQFSATGGAPPYAFLLTQNQSGGTVDPGGGLYHAGQTGNNARDQIQVNDSAGQSVFVSVTVTSNTTTTPLNLTPRTATTAPRGKVTFQASGGRAPYGFTITHNGSQGSVTVNGQYTAGTVGSSSDTVTVVDADQQFLAATVTVGPGISVAPQGSSVAANGTRTFTASGGAGAPYNWSTTGGTITSDGVLTAPAGGGQVIVTASDKNGNTATSVVTVGGAISLVPAETTVAAHGTVQFTAGGGSGTGYTFTLVTSPPTGATIDAGSGLYTAGNASNATDTVEVVDSEGAKTVATVHVGAASGGLVLTAYGSTNVGAYATIQFTAAGGSGHGYAFSVPVNPSGGTIDALTGAYTAGRSSGIDTVKVTDSANDVATATVQVTALPNDVPGAPTDGGATVPGSSSSSGTPKTVTVGGDDGCSSTPSNGASGVTAFALGMLGLAFVRRRRR